MISTSTDAGKPQPFQTVDNFEKLYNFMTQNLFPVTETGWNVDYNGRSDARAKHVIFLPLTIEQTRRIDTPICTNWEKTKDDEIEKNYRMALGANCEKKMIVEGDDDVKFTLPLKWGHWVDHPLSIKDGALETSLCPPYTALNRQYNLTSTPFKQQMSELSPGKKVYRLENLSPLLHADVKMGAILQALKDCYWFDLLTEEVVISVPFVTMGDGTFGNIRYTAAFSQNGIAKTSHTVSYARSIESAEEYYARLSSGDPARKNIAQMALIARVYLTIFLILEIVLRNFSSWASALASCRKKANAESTPDGTPPVPLTRSQKVFKVLRVIFPGMTEILCTFLLIMSATIPTFYQLINKNVGLMDSQISFVGERGVGSFDAKFSDNFITNLRFAQSAMMNANWLVCICMMAWLWKMMILFSNTSSVHVIPTTLVESLPKLFDLLIVIYVLVGTFAGMAMICYGHILPRWTSPFGMVLEVYRMMLGDYGDQYAEMYQEDRLLAVILFLFFSIVLMMIIVNIFMSIVMDTYAEVNKPDHFTKAVAKKAAAVVTTQSFKTRAKTACCPKGGSRTMLIPHLVGFSLYLYSTHVSYGLSSVNDSLQMGLSYLVTSANAGVQTFHGITSHGDAWNYLRQNVVPVESERAGMDYNGVLQNKVLLESPSWGRFITQNTIPVQFLPFTIEQHRRDSGVIPACEDYDPATDKHFRAGLQAECETNAVRKFGQEIDTQNNGTLTKCPGLEALVKKYGNFSSDPFEPISSSLEDVPTTVYSIQNIATYVQPFDTHDDLSIDIYLKALQDCYWIDMGTKKLVISIPFIAKANKVFGNLKQTIEFSRAGVPKMSSVVVFGNDSGGAGEGIGILSILYMFVYLTLDIAIRNIVRLKRACCNKSEEENSAKGFKKPLIRLKKIVIGLFPGMPEYCSLYLLVGGIITTPLKMAVSESVGQLVVMVSGIGTGKNDITKPAFVNEFMQNVKVTTNAQSFCNYFILTTLAVFLLKMLLVFSETKGVDVIPRTLVKSLPHIAHLLIVIFALVGSFAGMIMVIYGHILPRWTSPYLMLLEVYDMMLGNWGDQYEEMYSHDKTFAVILFLFFSIVLMMTVMNIFLSVVLDTYAEVTEEISEKERESDIGPMTSAPCSAPEPANPLGDVGGRLRNVRMEYGAGSEEYKAALKEVDDERALMGKAPVEQETIKAKQALLKCQAEVEAMKAVMLQSEEAVKERNELLKNQETYKTEITNLQDKLRQMEINAGIRDERGKQVDPAPAPSE